MADDRTIRVRLLSEISSYRQGMQQAASDTAKFGRQVGSALTESSQKMQQMGSTLNTRVTLPLLAAAAAATKLSVDFDSTFRQMVGLAGVTADEVEGLKESVLDLAVETGRSPQELAEGLYFVRSAGVAAGNGVDILTEAARGAAAGLGSTASVADLLTSVIGAYGQANIDAAAAADILAATAREGKAEAAQLAPQMGRLLPIASELGVTFDEVGAALAFLSRSGGGAELASTNLGNVLQKLLTPAQEGVTVLDRIGLSTDDLRASIADRGLLETLVFLRESLEANGLQLSDFSRDAQFTNGALALTAEGGERAREVFDALANATGAADEAFAAVAEGSGFKMQQALASIQAVGIRVGDAIGPVVADIAELVATVVEAFAALPGPVRTAIIVMSGMAAAAGPIATVAGRVKQLNGFLTGLGPLGARAASGLGALAGAVGLAAVVWVDYTSRQQAAKARAQEYTDAIRSQTGAVIDNINAVTAKRFADSDIIQSAAEAGASLDVLATAARDVDGLRFGGLKDALLETQAGALDVAVSGETMRAVLEEAGLAATPLGEQLLVVAESGEFTGRAFLDLLNTLGLINVDFQRGKTQADALTAAQEALGIGTGEAADGMEDLTDATQDQSEATQQLTRDIEAMADAIQSSLGNSLSLQEANIRSREALEKYNEVLADGEATARDREQAGVDLLQTYLAEGEAAKQLAEDQATAAGDAENATRLGVEAQIRELQGLASTLEPGSPLRVQLDGYIQALLSIPEEQATFIQASSNIDEVVADILRHFAILQARTPNIRIPIASGRDLGAVARSQVGGNASGGFAGMGRRGPTDTIPAWLTEGEFVINAKSARLLGTDLLEMLNAVGFAGGGVVEQARAATAALQIRAGMIGGTSVGRSVVVDDDIDATNQALLRLAETYERVRALAGASAAEQLLYSASTADEFDRLASAAEDAIGRLKIQYEVGAVSADDYLASLREQLAGQERFSDEWYSTWQEILRVEQEALREQERIEDVRYELGLVSTEQRKATLLARLANEEQFSERYVQIQKELMRLDAEVIDHMVRQRRKVMDDLEARRDEMAQRFLDARRIAAETGEDFQTVFDRLTRDAAKEAALEAEARRFALRNTPRAAPAVGDLPDARSLHAWNRASSTFGGGGSTTIVAFPDATIRENVDMAAAWQQIAALRARESL